MNGLGANDSRREWLTVILLMSGFGLVGLDRRTIAPLFPAMVKDLGISYEDLGLLVGVLGMSWGLVAPVAGNLADRFGRRRVLVPAIAAFSLLSILSSLASGMRELMVIRALMGVAEGAFCTACFAATNDASTPERRGFNIGLMMRVSYGLRKPRSGPGAACALIFALVCWLRTFRAFLRMIESLGRLLATPKQASIFALAA